MRRLFLAQAPPEVWDLLLRGDVVAVFVVILWSGAKGIWVWGKTYQEIVADRDYYRARAFENLGYAEDAVEVAENVVGRRRR